MVYILKNLILSFLIITSLLSTEIEYDIIAIPSPLPSQVAKPINLDARGRFGASVGSDFYQFSPPHYEGKLREFEYHDSFIEYNFDHIHNSDNYPTQEPTAQIVYINKRGLAVGLKRVGNSYAVFFLENGKEKIVKTNLPTLHLTNMNNQGQAVGFYGNADASRSFIFDKKGKYVSIGSENHPIVFANAINDYRQVVGDLGYGEGFIWDSVQGLRKLTNLISDREEWVFHDVRAINNRGEILCAAYLKDNPDTFYLLLLKPKQKSNHVKQN